MSLIDRITRHVDRLQAQLPFVRINEGDAMRMLLERGLESVEATTPPPPPPIQAQPPLALEPAPATEVQPTRTNKTLSSRRKDGKGRNPGLSPEKLQQIANTAAQYEKLSLAELSKLLFDRDIHQSIDSTTGAAKPVNPGTLKKWLDRAREQGFCL
jgi:hypothetical protein